MKLLFNETRKHSIIFFLAHITYLIYFKVLKAIRIPNLLRHSCFTLEKYHHIQNFIFIVPYVVVILVLHTLSSYSDIICKFKYFACRRILTRYVKCSTGSKMLHCII